LAARAFSRFRGRRRLLREALAVLNRSDEGFDHLGGDGFAWKSLSFVSQWL
jgi:hypothetical protein